MMESGYYPPGAENDPRAPWNQSDPEPVTAAVEYSCTMCRTVNVETTDYVPGTTEKEWDGDGYVAVHYDDDFSDTDWMSEFKNQNRTPMQLIKMLADIATSFANGHIPEMRVSEWKDIAADCAGWELNDEDITTV